MKGRIFGVFIVVVFFWMIILVRASFLQVFPNERLEKLKQRQFNRTITIRSKRGSIYDRQGRPLAFSVTSYSLFADPKIIKHPSKVAKKISKYLQLPEKQILKKLEQKTRRFTWIKKKLTKKDREHIKSWRVRGLGFIKEPKRLYPNERLLGQVLGFVGQDRGLEGLEKQHDEALKGEKKSVEVLKDARGRSLLEGDYLFSSIEEGQDVHLTIDSELQYVLEKELDRAIKTYKAKSAVGVVLDARNSEILAMTSLPDFDPNHPGKYPAIYRKNRVVTDIFEPGSTIKTFVVAGALREKVAAPNSVYFCENGSMRVGNRVIREADKRHFFQDLTVSEILSKSSNIGIAKLAFDLGSESLHKTLKDFGFGEKIGLRFPGEGKGIVKQLPWHKHLLSNISFGHGVATTTLQMANAYAVIANGGLLFKPSLVKPKNEKKIRKPIRRVLSKENAEKMKIMLTGVTGNGGTGSKAQVRGFPVAGKTGTAQKVNPNGRGYLKDVYISSFGGFIPAHEPRFVIYVALDSPKEKYYGSQVAAPIFAKVASFAVRKYGLHPVLLSEKDLMKARPIKKGEVRRQLASMELKKKASKKPKVIPNLHGLSLREAVNVLGNKRLKLKVKGRGRVSHTWPSSGNLIPKDQTLSIILQ